MAPSIILVLGLDHIPTSRYPANIITILTALRGFGTTPIRFILMGAQRHNKELRLAILDAIQHRQEAASSEPGPSSVDVESIDSPQDASAQHTDIASRPELVNQWLSARVAELAAGMGGMKSSGESSAQSLEANHGSDSDGTAAAARVALESLPSPFASTLGCVVVVDSHEHQIPVVGEGHCIEIKGEDITPREAWKISQVVRRTPSATQRHGLPTDVDLTGIVKRYNPTKGFGFITVNEQDVFVHQSHICAEGFRALNVGATVSLRVEIKNGKPEARSVTQRTPYVATYESDILVEGAHKLAGAPIDVRKEKKNSIRPPPKAQQKKPTKKKRAVSAPAKQKDETNNTAGRTRAASASATPHPRGQLVFSSESIPYSFRAHDGTLYYFPMPILERSTSQKKHKKSAEMVTGGVGVRRGPHSGPFTAITPYQQQALSHAPLPPPYALSRRLQATSMPLASSQSGDFGVVRTPTQPNVRRHSPYEQTLAPPPRQVYPQPQQPSYQPLPAHDDAEHRLRQLVNQNNIRNNLAPPPNGSYAAALLAPHKAAQSAPVLRIRTEEQSMNAFTAGIVQVPRRQR